MSRAGLPVTGHVIGSQRRDARRLKQRRYEIHAACTSTPLWRVSLVGRCSALVLSPGSGLAPRIPRHAADPSWPQERVLRRTILEVLHYDPQTREGLVVSGWEGKTDWYRNIEREPALEVRIGRVHYRPAQEFLSPEETAQIVLALFRRHPREVRFVGRLLGIDPEAPDAALRARIEAFFWGVRFRPATT
jgi:hypothetical protein